jgi:hypothetical protein
MNNEAATTTKRNYVNDWRTVEVDGRTVYAHRYSILSTDTVIYAAYEDVEKSAAHPFGDHSSLLTHPALDRWVGTVDSKALPIEVDALPVGPARFVACDAFRAANCAIAQRAILLAYPEASKGTARGPEVTGTLKNARRAP